MAYFSDLSSYRYDSRNQPGVVHIGWLDATHLFPQGKVAPHLIEKMKTLATKPTELYRGTHICELCSPEITSVRVEKEDPRYGSSRLQFDGHRLYCPKECMSNGEIRVAEADTIFAAPALIIHYIEAHGYLPPAEFLNALEKHHME
jgi:hypothetical protein